jgi:hypothetical protein
MLDRPCRRDRSNREENQQLGEEFVGDQGFSRRRLSRAIPRLRPPKEVARELDERILDVARQLFGRTDVNAPRRSDRRGGACRADHPSWSPLWMRKGGADAVGCCAGPSRISRARSASQRVILVMRSWLGATARGRNDQLASFTPQRLATTARFFLDLVDVPFLLRGLFEVNPRRRKQRSVRRWRAAWRSFLPPVGTAA